MMPRFRDRAYALKTWGVNEADETKTKNKTRSSGFSDPASKGDVSAASKKSQPSMGKKLPGRAAGARDRNVSMPNMDAFSQAIASVSRAPDEDSKLPARRTAKTPPSTLPAKTSSAVANTTEFDQDTESDLAWHNVRDLPMFRMFKSAFDPLFKELLGAPCSELLVTTTLPGAGTSFGEMKTFVNYLFNVGNVTQSLDKMEAFGIDRDMYRVENAWVVDFPDAKFFVMKEIHHGDDDKPIYYVYRSSTSGSNTVRL